MRKPHLITLFTVLALGGCISPGPGPYGYGVPNGGVNTIGGSLLGAVGGGILGSQFGRGDGQLAATAAGTLLGAMVGNSFGRSLDRADETYARRYGSHYYAPPAYYHAPSACGYGRCGW